MRVSGTTAALFLGAVIQASAATAAPQVEELTRTGPWVARFDENACNLVGQFGTGDTAVMIRLTHFAPDDNFDLRLFGQRFKGTGAMMRLGISFDPKAKIERSDHLMGKLGTLPMVMFGNTRLDGWQRTKDGEIGPVITPAMEAAVESMDIAFVGRTRVRLLTGGMGKAMATMRTCMDGLLKHWGFDPQVEANLSRRLQPKRSPERWLSSEDYPSEALAGGHNGVVDFRLDVDSVGNVEKCHILSATKPSDFETATCNGITKRAQFFPALDAKGQPVRSFYVNSVKWLAGP